MAHGGYIRFNCENVGTRELEDLFRAADLGGRVGEKIRRAFTNSQVVCLAYAGSRLIGASRAITDGEYHALVYDVAILFTRSTRGTESADA